MKTAIFPPRPSSRCVPSPTGPQSHVWPVGWSEIHRSPGPPAKARTPGCCLRRVWCVPPSRAIPRPKCGVDSGPGAGEASWHFGGIAVGTVVSVSGTPVRRFSDRGRSRWGTLVAAAGVASLLISGLPTSPAAADIVADIIDVGPEASDVAVNPVTNTVYVTTRDGLTVINGKTQATVKITTGSTPVAVAVNTATNKIYLSLKSDPSAPGSVAIVNGATHAVARVTVGAAPGELVIDQKTNKIYAGTLDGVSVINGSTNASTIINSGSVSTLVINQVTHRLYTLGGGGLNVIDTATNAVTRIDLGTNAMPSYLAVNQVTNKVYVAVRARQYAALEVVDGATNQAGGMFSDLNASPTSLSVDEKNNRVYFGRTSLGDGTISSRTGLLAIFDDGGPGRVDIRTGAAPGAIAVNGTTNKVYFEAGYRGTTVVDGKSFALSTLSHPFTGTLAVNEATNKIYASNWQGSVTIIDGNSPTPLKNDFSGDRKTDLLARDASGVLWLYPGNGAAGWLPRTQVGSAWNSMTAVVSPGDFNGDKKPDVLARDGAGHLWMYPGNGAGGWLARVHVGSGWNAITAIVTPGDFNGDGTADILARDTSGTLWLYPGDGRGDWLPRTNLGTGWNALTAIVGSGDFNSDGTPDVLARDGSGVLWLYNGNGTGGWAWDRQKVGEGWNSMTAIVAPGDFNGDGRPDIVARDGSGSLFLYPSASDGAWLPTVRIGQGWNGMTALL
ncbi:hypothetical protein CGK93_22880 [Arthrobacter sp. YN]|nr:hypothetical protein CGK93_22880 [Arthrobacter sp. YN]